MNIELKTKAIDYFNSQADKIINQISEVKDLPDENNFPSEVHTSHSITKKQIVGDIATGTVDYMGNIVSRFFDFNGQYYGLDVEAYSSVKVLANKIIAIKEINNLLCVEFIENVLFNWLKQKFLDIKTNLKFVDSLYIESERSIKKRTIWIPIANVEVLVPFQVADTEIRSITPEQIEKWKKKSIQNRGKDDFKESEINLIFDDLKVKVQGYAAVVVSTHAEYGLAKKSAIKKAQQVASILGMYTGATRYLYAKCSCRIKGTEHVEKCMLYSEDKFHIAQAREIIDKTASMPWQLTTRAIRNLRKHSLDTISALLVKEHLTDFQASVLNFTILYSKSAYTGDPLEKLVFILSALESLLLKKNKKQYIKQVLANRISTFLTSDSEKREEIRENVREVYKIRSKYLHHGLNAPYLKQVEIFMNHIWLFFSFLIKQVQIHETKHEFLMQIDNS